MHLELYTHDNGVRMKITNFLNTFGCILLALIYLLKITRPWKCGSIEFSMMYVQFVMTYSLFKTHVTELTSVL